MKDKLEFAHIFGLIGVLALSGFVSLILMVGHLCRAAVFRGIAEAAGLAA